MPVDVSVELRGLDRTVKDLERVEKGVGDARLLPVMKAAAGLVHRYLMGLKRDTPRVGETGVLPVIGGRLAGSFDFDSGRRGGETVGIVYTNLDYARPVERRRGFMAKTLRNTERPVRDFIGRYVAGVTNG